MFILYYIKILNEILSILLFLLKSTKVESIKLTAHFVSLKSQMSNTDEQSSRTQGAYFAYSQQREEIVPFMSRTSCEIGNNLRAFNF